MIPVFHFFGKGEQGTIKSGKSQLLEMARFCYIVIFIDDSRDISKTKHYFLFK